MTDEEKKKEYQIGLTFPELFAAFALSVNEYGNIYTQLKEMKREEISSSPELLIKLDTITDVSFKLYHGLKKAVLDINDPGFFLIKMHINAALRMFESLSSMTSTLLKSFLNKDEKELFEEEMSKNEHEIKLDSVLKSLNIKKPDGTN